MTAAVTGAARAASGAARKASGTAKGTSRRRTPSTGERERRAAAEEFEAAARRPARTEAQRQREGIQAIKDSRPAEPAPEPAPAPTAAPRQSLEIPGARAANTGGGFLLGLGAWIIVRTYLDGGPDAVKKLLKAKFFNEVS